MQLTHLLPTVALLFCSACASMDAAYNEMNDSGFDATGMADTTDTASGQADAPPTDTADALTHWTLTGQLTLLNQAIDLSQSDLRLSLRSADQTPCEPSLSTQMTQAQPADSSDPMLTVRAGWDLILQPLLSPNCPLPDNVFSLENTELALWLGFGPVDPIVYPAAEANGFGPDLQSGTVLGLYVQLHSDEPIYIIGLVGTPDQFPAISTSETDLPDGDYQLIPLYQLPL